MTRKQLKEKERKFELDLIYTIIENNYKRGIIDKYDIFLLANDILEMTRKVYQEKNGN